MWSRKAVVWAIAGLLALSAVVAVGSHFIFQHGIQRGLDIYHRMCYDVGGLVVDENTGTVVQCQPVTKIPKKELDNFKKTLYTG